MPLEVRQLVVKTTIDEPSDREDKTEPIGNEELLIIKEEIIEECMEKVKEMLERQLRR